MMIEQLTELRFAADIGMAVLIWLVQLVIYPAFRAIAPHCFADWHHQYMKTISWIVVPMMLLQAACHGLVTTFQPSPEQWVANGALIGAWITTFALSVPCHQKLQRSGYRIATINRLIQTNWLRTLCWSLPLPLGIV
jgi:hypothetical protein